MSFDENTNNLMTGFLFSELEQETFFSKLWELLKQQAEKYNGMDSTSMPIEKAQDILESLLYTIMIVVENGCTKNEILNDNLSLLLKKGQSILKEKQKAAKVEWKLMCQELPQIMNVYYLSTIENLGTFFGKYDIYYEAHHIPCSIDYWLMCPISENVKGVSFIEEYLHRLQMENDFITCFESIKVVCLYEKYIPDYKESLFNLCEPILTNAIGLEMINHDIFSLTISAAQRNIIFDMLIYKTADEIQRMITQSVLNICRKIGMKSEHEIHYFTRAAEGLSARICEAIKHNDLSHIFISFDRNLL